MASKKRRPTGPTYHLERGADGVDAFFIFTLARIYRIEILSIALGYVIFRVVYPDRSYRFGFRFGKPFIYPLKLREKIRIQEDAYQELYRLADVFMHAVLAGYRETYDVKYKGYHWLNSGERFKIKLLTKMDFVLEVERRLFEFGWDEGECFIRGSDEGMPSALRHFLFGFVPLAFAAYKPYVRVKGTFLAELSLFPDFEKEPVRKQVQLRHRRNLKRLKDMGKPAVLAPPKKLRPAVQGELFAYRTLPE